MAMLFITTVIFVLLLFLCFFQGLSHFFIQHRVREWPLVTAKITHSTLLHQFGPDGVALSEGLVKFQYAFEGRAYEANTPARRGYDLFPCVKYETYLVEKYKAGNVVSAHVCPTKPEVAFLEVAPYGNGFVVLMLAIITLALVFVTF